MTNNLVNRPLFKGENGEEINVEAGSQGGDCHRTVGLQ